ncbi:hypothetical protein HYPSUDRAFT_121280, partial [Hypholoma sublateritium FD-334 SS-4]
VVFRLRLPDSYPMHPFLASPEYEVEAIIGHRLLGRKHGNRRQYRVRWVGYGPAEDSWISEYDLRNAPELKREYL